MAFPPTIRLIRGYLIDYLSKDRPLTFTLENIRRLLSSKQLTLQQILETIDKIEEDPLCVPYISREEKRRKLEKLRKALSNLPELEGR